MGCSHLSSCLVKYIICPALKFVKPRLILDNIICLPRQPVRRLCPFRVLRKGVVLMYVTYGDLFTFVMMITGIIALIYQIHKK